MKNKLFVKNCYIERRIYSNVFMEQDVRHRVELNNVELLYEKMYPGENLQILTLRNGTKQLWLGKGTTLEIQSFESESPWLKNDNII